MVVRTEICFPCCTGPEYRLVLDLGEVLFNMDGVENWVVRVEEVPVDDVLIVKEVDIVEKNVDEADDE